MKHRLYNIVGALYVIFSLPPVVFLLTGRLQEVNPFYTIALGGIPMGVIFLAFGMKRFTINHVSNVALKFAMAALAFNIPLFIAYVFIRAGYPSFEDLVLASDLGVVLLSLNSFLLTLLALVRGHARTSEASRVHQSA
jgi:hypothetical protein